MSSEIKKCKDCLEELSIREVLIIKIKCWKCKKDMLAAGLLIGDDYIDTPEEMTEKDISIAKDSGVILEERFSKTTKSTYLANICPSCNMFTGSFPLTEHIIDTLHGKDYKKIRSGYSCLNCEEV